MDVGRCEQDQALLVPATMANSDARIRNFQPDDLKLAQFVISKANLSKLAVANYTGEADSLLEDCRSSLRLNSSFDPLAGT